VHTLVSLSLGALSFAVVFWVSVYVLSGGNPRNRFLLALFFGFILAIFNSLGGWMISFIPLAAIMMLLVNYIQLGVIRSMIVMFILIGMDVVWAVLYIKLCAGK